MPAKLHIDASSGTLDVEGEEAFVREIYQDFRSLIAAGPPLSSARTKPTGSSEIEDVELPAPRKKSTAKARRKVSGDDASVRVGQYSPSVLKDLNLTGLREYFAQFEPKIHTERVLIFATFLRDEKGISPCSADHIYTCYRFVKERAPDAFVQAIRDASTKKSYIDYQSVDNITVTNIGDNVFLHDLARKEMSK